MSNNIRIFSGSASIDFTRKICNYLDVSMGNSDTITFSEGNTFVRINEPVRGEDVYLVQSIGIHPNDELVELLFWLDAFKRASARSVTAIIPYLSYAKGDKKDEPRVSIRARVCAECIELAGADRIVTMDLHSPQIQGFFKKPLDHLQAMLLMCEYVKSSKLENFVIVSPDAGYARQARLYSSYLGVPAVIGDKIRIDHSENASILNIVGGDIKGKNAVIVDDFSISGGTLDDLSYMLKAAGAEKIIACVSHLLFNEKALQRLCDSEIDTLVCTDSICNPLINMSHKVRQISAAPLFAEAILRIHNNHSISPLFNTLPDKVLQFSNLL